MDVVDFLFSPNGRVRRRTYAMVLIGVLMFQTVGAFVLAAILPESAIIVLIVAPLWVFFAASVKRYHDRGKSGWWSLLLLIPVLNFVAVLGLLLGSPDGEENAYGANPRTNAFAATA